LKKNSKNKVARVYSAALYEVASNSGDVDGICDDIVKLHSIVKEDANLVSYLTNPLWSEIDKIDVLKRTADILGLKKETFNCLKVVVENNRVSDLLLILDDFKKLYYHNEGVAEVVVETVKKLTSIQDKKLKKVLEKIANKKVVVEYKINPLLVGGLRVQIGSEMFDDSLAHKLNYLENVMKGK